MRARIPGKIPAVSLGLLLVTTASQASHRSGGRPAYPAGDDDRAATIIYAQVIDVHPVVEQVRTQVPVRECYETTAYLPGASRPPATGGTAGPTIAGGVVGGVIGNQFGRGDGRDAMRLFGVLVGAALGHDAAARRQAGYYPVANQAVPATECTTHYETRIDERTRGYDVAYVYDGREYRTRMANPPGDRIPVEVSVRPAW